MRPTRRTQPYRQGLRQPGAALTSMLRGSTATGWNPIDTRRAAYLMAAGKKHHAKRGRPPRPARTQRPSRPPR